MRNICLLWPSLTPACWMHRQLFYSEKGLCSCRRHVPPQLEHDFSKPKAGKAHILAFSFGHKTRRKEEEGDVANACLPDFSSVIP